MKRLLLVIAVLGGCGLNLNNDDAGSTDPGTTGTGGGGGGGSSGGITAAQAQADCSAFFSDNYCPAVVSCSPAGTTDQETCLAQVRSQIDCTHVVSETAALPTCKSDLGRTTCDEILRSLPLSCQSVFATGA